MKTSIIFTACDTTQLLRQITCLSLQSIVKYTDEADYELIFIDTIKDKEYKLDDAYNALELNARDDRRWLKQTAPDPGQYECYNIGARQATGDYLCFFQNDVFVSEGWLKALTYYLDNDIADVVFPDQAGRKRSEIVEFANRSPEEAIGGGRDAGLILMTKAAFTKIGGWDGRMRRDFGEAALFNAATDAGLRLLTTVSTTILHIAGATGWHVKEFDTLRYDQEQTISVEVRDAKG